MSTFNELAKVLALEQNIGYTNKSAVGGIETYVANWANRTRTPENQDLVAQIVGCFENYSQAEPPQRKIMIERALALARQAPVPPPQANPRAKTAPRAPQHAPAPPAVADQIESELPPDKPLALNVWASFPYAI
ncbi:MAG: hypothetical protein DCC52_13405 [Chloroflexi bacterium]|nr:MAG: hypothetical protein DCC52_13405 [Chloroflexota bacterium]